MKSLTGLLLLAFLTLSGCSVRSQRGIADKRTEFRAFLPMKQNPANDGLRRVKPYFKRASRPEVLRAIERACEGHKAGSSYFNPATGEGYYVNCNPRNRQLLNGYVPSDASRAPHSHP